MPKFKIEATRKMCMFVIVEADNYEEAEKLYDNELIADDYQEDEGGSWTLNEITELEEEFTCKCGAEFPNEGDLIHHKLTWC